jgi:hypothetical protein
MFPDKKRYHESLVLQRHRLRTNAGHLAPLTLQPRLDRNMLARLYILLPYTLTVPEGEEFPIYEMVDGEYRIRLLPPLRDPAALHGRRPEGLTMNGKPAFEANVMRIDFRKEEFNRKAADPIDPPEDIIRRAVSEFHARLRFTTRAAHAQPVSFPWSQWRLEYTNDDGSALEPLEGCARARGSIQVQWSFVGLSRQVWDAIFDLPPEFEVPVWDGLRLDAQAALPNVGTAVVLAATSLEVFISVLLDQLASSQNLDQTLWKWIKERDGKYLQQLSVEEQFDVLLKYLAGHSLKEESLLWEAFKNLKSARNTFVHEGVARVGNSPLTKERATALIGKVDEIVAKVREWIPEHVRWPVPQTKADFQWTHVLIEPSKPVQPAVEGAAGG